MSRQSGSRTPLPPPARSFPVRRRPHSLPTPNQYDPLLNSVLIHIQYAHITTTRSCISCAGEGPVAEEEELLQKYVKNSVLYPTKPLDTMRNLPLAPIRIRQICNSVWDHLSGCPALVRTVARHFGQIDHLRHIHLETPLWECKLTHLRNERGCGPNQPDMCRRRVHI